MKKYLLLLTFATTSFLLSAHAFFFAHAELEYKPFSSQFELTLSVTAHDLELVFGNDLLLDEMQPVNPVKDEWKDSLCQLINQHFSLKDSGFRTTFILIGSDLNKNGILNIYLVSDAPKILANSFEVMFDLFVNAFPDQENKLTFIHESKYLSLSFNKHLRSDQLKLNQ